MKSVLAAVDVGGTSLKMAFVTHDGEIAAKWEIPTNQSDKGAHIISEAAASIKEKQREYNVDIGAVGVGAPGFIDVERGFIYEAVNVGWKSYPLREEMESLLGLPVVVDNDANLAAGGEKWKGAGGGADNLLAVTLGTGVGGGIIAGGSIIHGQSGMAGEIGHITAVREGGARCNCGKNGCLETVASATGIARIGREKAAANPSSSIGGALKAKGSLSAKEIIDAAKNGDHAAEEAVNEAADHLGFALANLCNSLNPETIVIGGGVSKAGDYLVEKITASFKTYAIPKIAAETTIRLAELGNDAGVIGAAWLAAKAYRGEGTAEL
ncbi:ROK family glucokinase [Alkalicoccus urumqiensis]|uniref:Glucokinase n=1 Tax=Alkalicoccus urumqiensis TaxID=1548213 RepID=A0A2P6MK70_ALKUR|nr:ROK family glucokinase [Alkalicoccus urumqiensis]PRO66680.1 glucokinase [Alkalicoccus urumqiensis]